MLRCTDGSLYTGITTDVARRFEEHKAGKGAKYTRSRKPIEIVYREPVDSYSAALRREYAIKQLSREQKIALINKEI